MEIEISKQYLILNVWILNFNREMIIEKKDWSNICVKFTNLWNDK